MQPLPSLSPSPVQPCPGGVGWKPAVPRRGAATAREQREPLAEVSCKTSSALVGQRCCLGVARPSLPASPSGRTPWNTDRLMRFARHAVGKCSDQGSAEWGDMKPKGKRRATADHAAEIPAASLQRAAPAVPRPQGEGSPREAAGCQMCRCLPPLGSGERTRGSLKMLWREIRRSKYRREVLQSVKRGRAVTFAFSLPQPGRRVGLRRVCEQRAVTLQNTLAKGQRSAARVCQTLSLL